MLSRYPSLSPGQFTHTHPLTLSLFGSQVRVVPMIPSSTVRLVPFPSSPPSSLPLPHPEQRLPLSSLSLSTLLPLKYSGVG